jgi:hypothetical protein
VSVSNVYTCWHSTGTSCRRTDTDRELCCCGRPCVPKTDIVKHHSLKLLRPTYIKVKFSHYVFITNGAMKRLGLLMKRFLMQPRCLAGRVNHLTNRTRAVGQRVVGVIRSNVLQDVHFQIPLFAEVTLHFGRFFCVVSQLVVALKGFSVLKRFSAHVANFHEFMCVLIVISLHVAPQMHLEEVLFITLWTLQPLF